MATTRPQEPHFDLAAYLKKQNGELHGAETLESTLRPLACAAYALEWRTEPPADYDFPGPDDLCDLDFLRSVKTGTWAEYARRVNAIHGRFEFPTDNGLRFEFVLGALRGVKIDGEPVPGEYTPFPSVVFEYDEAGLGISEYVERGVVPAFGRDAGKWAALDPAQRPEKHPLHPVVSAWVRAAGGEVERKKGGIMPRSISRATAIITKPYGEGIGFADTGQREGTLFDLECAESVRVPYALRLWDLRGGDFATLGGGRVPYGLRLWNEGILSIPYAARQSARAKNYSFTLRDAVQWLGIKNYRPGRDYPLIMRALSDLHNLFVSLPEGDGFWCVFTVRKAPGKTLDSRGIIAAQFPPGSQNGAWVDRETLREYATQSVRKWRAWLGIAEYWDMYGTSKKGKSLIRATRPAVLRNEKGYLLDGAGRIITGRSGVPVENNWDSRAIRTGETERNPAADRYPFLNPDQCARIVFGEPPKKLSREEMRNNRKRARATLLAMADDGKISLESSPTGGVRILPPALPAKM